MTERILHAPPDLDVFAHDGPSLTRKIPRRLNAEPGNVERGLAQLVLTVVELLRNVMERQAIRLMDEGILPDEQVERLGRAFMELDDRMRQLLAEFELDAEDLNLPLGPLRDLL
jgi:Gas vesicle protein K